MNAEVKQLSVEAAVLDVITYFAIFEVLVELPRINALLPVKASHLAVQAAVRELIRQRKVQRLGDGYGLTQLTYAGAEKRAAHREELLRRARKAGKLIGLLPFVKAVVVVNSVAIGNVHANSDVDLLIVTTPGRVFVAKGLLWQLMKLTRQLETEERKAGRFSLGMFLTTRGIIFERDTMKQNEPHLMYWLMTAVPVYGDRRWYEILQGSAYVRSHAPNYLWPRGGRSIDRSGWKQLDALDDRGYKIHLKHTSQQEKNHTPEAFVRVRPDIINLHAQDASRGIAERWHKLRGTWVEPDTQLTPLRATDSPQATPKKKEKIGT